MILFKSRCYNGGNQHNFQPRFSKREGPAIVPKVEEMDEHQIFWSRYAIEESHETTKTYHGDVCVWCGKVVNDQQPEKKP